MRFKLWKVDNDFTMAELARQLRISVPSLENIMSGKSWPLAKNAEKIFELTRGKVTISDLYDEWFLYRRKKETHG